MDTEHFIKQFAFCDVRNLALKADKYPDVDMPYALDQIAGRQIAVKKLPSWAATEGVIYPPHISMEQCSSEFTAIYKRDLLRRVAGNNYILADITGGFGVDFMYMSEFSSRATYVEHNAGLCAAARHNASLFKRNNAEIINSEAEDFVCSMNPADVVYADPARRNASGGRTYAVTDCTPDILQLLPRLLEKSRYLLVKLSPMLDLCKTVNDFNSLEKCVKEVHIISVSGECKELLLLLSRDASDDYKIHCVNDSEDFVFCSEELQRLPSINQGDVSGMFLYEPNASIMKAGCFGVLSERFSLSVLARNSNLFVTSDAVTKFPGRSFRIKHVTTMNKKELARSLAGIKKANITVRNFPMSVAELRRRLKISDGGDVYIFATTLSSDTHCLLICEKAII